MKRSSAATYSTALAICCAVMASPSVHAGPITGPIWDVDTITQLRLRFTHGPVEDVPDTHVFNARTSPNGFWEFGNLTLAGFASIPPEIPSDAVTVTGRLFRHVIGPDEPGKGDPFAFFLQIPTVEISFTDTFSMATMHGSDHVDAWTATLSGTLQPATYEIVSYELIISAEHKPIPEPSTLGLLGLSLLVYSAFRRARSICTNQQHLY